jgi:hypothetical protein
MDRSVCEMAVAHYCSEPVAVAVNLLASAWASSARVDLSKLDKSRASHCPLLPPLPHACCWWVLLGSLLLPPSMPGNLRLTASVNSGHLPTKAVTSCLASARGKRSSCCCCSCGSAWLVSTDALL